MINLNHEYFRFGALKVLERRVVEHGHDWKDVSRAVGFDPDEVFDTDFPFPIGTLITLLEHAALVCGNDAEIFEETIALKAGAFSVLDYLAISAPSIRQSLQNWARFQQTLNIALTARYKEDADWASIEYTCFEAFGPHTQFSYAVAAGAAARFMSLSDTMAESLELDIDAPRPSQHSPFVDSLGERLRFNQPCIRLRVAAAELDKPPPTSEINLYQIVETSALKVLNAHRCDQSPLKKVSDAINLQMKAGNVSLASVAGQLNMSERSLQRTIAAEGTSFRKMVEDTRREMAAKYLKETDLSLKEITFMLGFAELSAFSRAAKIWFGCSPKRYRETPPPATHNPSATHMSR